MNAEEIRERLEAAREELEALEGERGHLPSELEEARREDHEERMRAARSGGSIAGAVSGLVSRVRGLKERGEELPYLIWSARLRVLELEAEHREALAPALEERSDAARRESRIADETLRVAERRARDLSDAAVAAMREHTENWQEGERLRREVSALEISGPGAP